jgi:hypothetical protein
MGILEEYKRAPPLGRAFVIFREECFKYVNNSIKKVIIKTIYPEQFFLLFLLHIP